jgi:hypothetical protein
VPGRRRRRGGRSRGSGATLGPWTCNCKHFGVWPLAEAARACFGTDAWPPDRPVPRASIEFELAGADAVTEEAAELASGGFRLLHGARTEPWGQTVARLQTVEGLIVGLSHVPWLH